MPLCARGDGHSLCLVADRPANFYSAGCSFIHRAGGPDLDTVVCDGWIVTGRRLQARAAAPRQYLVAAESKEEAVALARKQLGKEYELEIVGAAHAVHFHRRGMKPGDMCEIGGKKEQFSERGKPRKR